ncbi:MAG TPA: matrixin family metalloprotease [Gemmatimonadaceae bacterium]|nr:matrixin family metalloprotease [Gemmatimonadaceae bacterium]
MKRIVIPFIGLSACIGTLAASHARPHLGGLSSVPAIKAESAGGNVSLRAALRDDDKAKARAKVRDQEAGTYIPEILLARDSSLARWRARERPVTVWVQSRPDLSDWNPDYIDAVSDAFMSWDAVELPVRFRMVRDSTDAEVHVTWLDRFGEPISGRTRWSRDDGWWIVNASIMLAIHHQSGDRLDRSAMKAMALHEVGHLLGLDHTSNVGSIMAPRVRVRDLADVDVATVRVLYSVPAGTLR